jgi:cutinase
MLSNRLLAVSLMSLALAAAQEPDNCPELPETGVVMGEPVPMHPEHIPAGCSDFEILVGKCGPCVASLSLTCLHSNTYLARGTSEPNYEGGDGKFGIIVGDPVVTNTTLRLPGARGYPVQVRKLHHLLNDVQPSNSVNSTPPAQRS